MQIKPIHFLVVVALAGVMASGADSPSPILADGATKEHPLYYASRINIDERLSDKRHEPNIRFSFAFWRDKEDVSIQLLDGTVDFYVDGKRQEFDFQPAINTTIRFTRKESEWSVVLDKDQNEPGPAIREVRNEFITVLLPLLVPELPAIQNQPVGSELTDTRKNVHLPAIRHWRIVNIQNEGVGIKTTVVSGVSDEAPPREAAIWSRQTTFAIDADRSIVRWAADTLSKRSAIETKGIPANFDFESVSLHQIARDSLGKPVTAQNGGGH